MSVFRFLISLGAVFLASSIQLANIFILGVKPNLVLVLIYILSLINKSWLERGMLIFASALVLNFHIFDFEIILFVAVSILGVLAIDNLPWTQMINIIASVFSGTLLINIYNFRLEAFVLELFFNLAFAWFLFMIVSRFTRTYLNDIPTQKIRHKFR